MKKEDLKSGMLVETREGKLYLVVGDFITKDNGFCVLEEFENNLKNKSSFRGLDIVKVYERYNDLYENYASSLKTLFDKERLKLLWERKEYKLTEREVEVLKALKTLDYEWLARDKDGELFAYRLKPLKSISVWFNDYYSKFYVYENLFTFIKWEDDEPINIKELLK